MDTHFRGKPVVPTVASALHICISHTPYRAAYHWGTALVLHALNTTLTLLAVSLISFKLVLVIPPDLFELICVPKRRTMHPYSALAVLFSTELASCRLIKLGASTRLTSFILRWKATQRGYNRARFHLESFFYCDMRASRNFLPMLKHGLIFESL